MCDKEGEEYVLSDVITIVLLIIYAICIISCIVIIVILIISGYLSGASYFAVRVDQGIKSDHKCDKEYKTVCTGNKTLIGTNITIYYMTFKDNLNTIVMESPKSSVKIGNDYILYRDCTFHCVSHDLEYDTTYIINDDVPNEDFHWTIPDADDDCESYIALTVIMFTVILLMVCIGTVGLGFMMISLLLGGGSIVILFINTVFHNYLDCVIYNSNKNLDSDIKIIDY